MKILVTGGIGFIGSHLVDFLIKNNHEVIVVDDLSTCQAENLNPKAEFYKENICNPDLEILFKKEKPEIVFHLAAKTNLRESIKEPLFYTQNNLIGSVNLLECCRKFDVKKFIYSSSGTRFAESNSPLKENSLVDPKTPYAISKYTVESYLKFYKEIYDLDCIALGYSNVYGPRQINGVVPIFIQRMLTQKPPVIFGDGNQTRDFIFVEDAVEATALAANKTKSSYLNISTGKETSINQVYFLIKNLANFYGHPLFEPAVKGEIRKTCLDNLKAKQELKWEPKTDLKQGIKKTIDYFKK